MGSFVYVELCVIGRRVGVMYKGRDRPKENLYLMLTKGSSKGSFLS